jgi:putative serine protease PepD
VPSTSGRAYLGVSVTDASDGNGATLGTVVAGSPAASAGLQAGDEVTAVDGTAVANAAALRAAIVGHQPGDAVSITYVRNGTSATAQVTLGTVPTTAG